MLCYAYIKSVFSKFQKNKKFQFLSDTFAACIPFNLQGKPFLQFHMDFHHTISLASVECAKYFHTEEIVSRENAIIAN